jgi:N-acetyl sugar amidotransferase
MNKNIKSCKRCLNDSYDQQIVFDEDGICNYCKRYDEEMKNFYHAYNNGETKFQNIILDIKKNTKKKYDCIIGLSGGVDSTYLAYLLKKYDIKVLAVHIDAGWNTELSVSNIQKIIDYTGFDLETVVIEWDEIKRLQVAFLKAEIMNQDIPQDHAFFASLYNTAIKEEIKYVFTGSNMQTEGMVGYYGHNAMDSRYLKDVFKKFGTGKLQKYPIINFFKLYFLIPFIYKIRVIKPFNYLGYDKEKATQILIDKVGYKPYKYKHGESVWTRFFQDYMLVNKFDFDKRKTHLSAQMLINLISKDEAREILRTPAYNMEHFQHDSDYIARKLEITPNEFKSYLKHKGLDSNFFLSNNNIYKVLKKLQSIIERITKKKISNYS